MTQWAWTMLGIAPTDDVRAIRSAYAAELKSFDVDADQMRFARLREARDVALQLARSAQAPVDSEPLVTATSDAALPYESPPIDAPVIEHDPNAAIYEATDAHYSALLALLSASDDGPLPDAATSELMQTHFRAILADPRMEQLSFRAAVEEQFLHILSSTAPRCDPILHDAVDAFGWRQNGGQLSQPQIVDALVNYADGAANRRRLYESAEQFRGELENPQHEHHRAWKELNKSADQPFTRRAVSVLQVHALLVTLNDYFSPLLHGLDTERVQFWEDKFQKREQRKNTIAGALGGLLFLAFIGVGLFAPKAPRDSRQPAYTVVGPSSRGLERFEVDVAPAVRAMMPDTTVASLKMDNPSLYKALEKRWESARDAKVTSADFSQSTVKWLGTLFDGNLERAQRAEVVAFRTIELKRLRLLDAAGDGACGRYLSGAFPPPQLAPADADQLAKLEAKLLRTIPYRARAPTPETKTFTVPGEVVDRVQAATGLPPKQLSIALRNDGPDRARCRVRMALIEAAINTSGKTGLTLLRSM